MNTTYKLTAFKLLIVITALSLLSGCGMNTKIVRQEIILPCIDALKLPDKPEYKFGVLPPALSPEAKAQAVYTLYDDWLIADAYASELRSLIAPCIGVKENK